MTFVRFFGAAAALVIAAAVVACGDGDEGGGSPSASPSAGASATASPQVTGTAGGETDPPGETVPPSTATEPSTETAPPAGDVTALTPVDKQHSLPADYVPPGLAALPDAYLAPGFGGSLAQEALDALRQMLDAADAAGYDIRCRSGYRSYTEQEATFNYWVSVLGYDEAVRVSAMPGHSEHQLGTACDLTSPEVGWDLIESFGGTAPGQWLEAHAHEYGWALSYPAGQEAVTGYAYEPWHFRYIGAGEAAAWKASGLTLGEYLR